MRIAAVILAFSRGDALVTVLERLRDLPVDEVVVVDNGLDAASRERTRQAPGVRLVGSGQNLGIAGRNLGAREANADLLLMLDDDSYPLPGALETLAAAFERNPRLAVAGGLVRDVDPGGRVLRQDELGTFDWYLRAGRTGPAPDGGFPAFFFPEGGCLLRRDAFLEVGGYFEPFFFLGVEVELTTRLVGAGWEVRYFPQAVFDHLKDQASRAPSPARRRLMIRNQLWYFWLRFPLPLAARRAAGYLLFDLVQALYLRAPGAWIGGIADAWRDRRLVRGQRRPLPRAALRRAELNRGRTHIRLLAGQARRRLPIPRRT
jgi:N-acetylglucosaminyl-diphospho-decaprenol L-rhamnosyltransferase